MEIYKVITEDEIGCIIANSFSSALIQFNAGIINRYCNRIDFKTAELKDVEWIMDTVEVQERIIVIAKLY